MKLIVVFASVLVTLCVLVEAVSAYPYLQFENQPQHGAAVELEEEPEPSNLGLRQKRVTCDLLSFSTKFGQLNHAACAANCIRLGRRGGACNNGVCVCRK